MGCSLLCHPERHSEVMRERSFVGDVGIADCQVFQVPTSKYLPHSPPAIVLTELSTPADLQEEPRTRNWESGLPYLSVCVTFSRLRLAPYAWASSLEGGLNDICQLECSSMVEHLPCMFKALGSTPNNTKRKRNRFKRSLKRRNPIGLNDQPGCERKKRL